MLHKHPIELIFSILFIALSIVLNLQFLEGSNINTTIAGHDEYIAVKEVYSILHPASLKHFIMAVISGNALYYGRIMFYVDAFFAFLPFKIWGVTGMVLSIRMFHALCLLTALLILSHTFLSTQKQKLLFFMGCFCLYFTMYFIMMPKPEPLQLLFLALFLKLFKSSNWSFGKHFIYLGIAYGLKFNVIIILPLLFLLPIIKNGNLSIKNQIWPGILSFFYTVLGIVVAIPCLILSPIKPIFLSTYLHETFGGTEKGYDNAALTFNDWMTSGLGGSYLGHGSLAYPFMVLVVVLIFLQFKKAFKTKDFSSFLILTIGLLLAMVIMLKTKRLWPHYLWTAYIFMWIGIISTLPLKIDTLLLKFKFTLILVFLGSSMFFYLYRELPLYLNLSKSEDVKNNTNWSQASINYVKTNYPGQHIATDGSILYPFEDFVAVDIYHPFAGGKPPDAYTSFSWFWDFPERIWKEPISIVMFYKRLPQRMLIEHPNVFVGRHQELQNIFELNVDSIFIKDTTIGEIEIYKRK